MFSVINMDTYFTKTQSTDRFGKMDRTSKSEDTLPQIALMEFPDDIPGPRIRSKGGRHKSGVGNRIWHLPSTASFAGQAPKKDNPA